MTDEGGVQAKTRDRLPERMGRGAFSIGGRLPLANPLRCNLAAPLGDKPASHTLNSVNSSVQVQHELLGSCTVEVYYAIVAVQFSGFVKWINKSLLHKIEPRYRARIS
jgi:hypothetical protein